MRIGVVGYYKLDVFKASTGKKVRSTGWFKNLITDLGMDAIGQNSSSNVLQRCHVGSGTATPAFTDTALANFVATSSPHNTLTGSEAIESTAPYFASRTITYEFAEGVAEGNLSEVGVGSTNTALISRALILDGAGDPTTITVLADEILHVTYQMQHHPQASDFVDTVTIAGAARQITVRSALVTALSQWRITSGVNNDDWNFSISPTLCSAFDGPIGDITSSPTGSNSLSSTQATATYTLGSFQRAFSVTWGLDKANFNIKSFQFRLNGFPTWNFQVELDTTINKTSDQELTIDALVSWARL